MLLLNVILYLIIDETESSTLEEYFQINLDLNISYNLISSTSNV